MTAHELAKKLLEGPDNEIVFVIDGGKETPINDVQMGELGQIELIFKLDSNSK